MIVSITTFASFKNFYSALNNYSTIIKSQQEQIKTLDKRIKEIESDDVSETSSLDDHNVGATDISSWVIRGNEGLSGQVFLTPEEANNYGKQYIGARNVKNYEVVPIDAELTYSNGEKADGKVYSCVFEKTE